MSRRYIDADKLQIIVDGYFSHIFLIARKSKKEDIKAIKEDMLGLLKITPYADVRENVRGEWIKYGDKYKCNRCFATMRINPINPNLKDRFCYFCGADMRKGEDNE